ncbi:Transposon Tf2-1 polyprotein, partial [Trametes pubescens]
MQSKDEVLRFLGLVQYLAHFLPDLSAFTSPLETISSNGHPFYWCPLHQTCLDRIKAMACKAPILKPIDPDLDEPIWVITDTSAYGVGAVYGQGPDWRTCRPAGFMSKKFTSAQRSYPTYEHEALGIIEALMKWEDRLMGRKFRIATDHEALLAMREAKRDTRSGRLIRWDEFLSRYDFEIEHVPRKDNKVADCLSRYFENDPPDILRPVQDYVNADVRLDPGLEDIVEVRKKEIESEVEALALRALREVMEDREREAEDMTASAVPKVLPPTESAVRVQDALQTGPPLDNYIQGEPGFADTMKAAYAGDTTFSKVLAHPKAYPTFEVVHGLLYVTNRFGHKVLCVPYGRLKSRSIRELVIDHAHRTLGHLGAQKTAEYARRWFWWPRMTRDIERFCMSCGACQMAKSSNALPAGLLHSMPVPLYPWQSVGMDF